MKKGVIVCFTGTDGSGKTTIARLYEEELKRSGISCEYLWSGWRAFESPLFKPVALLSKRLSRKKKDAITSLTDPPVPVKYNRYLFPFAWLDYLLSTYPRIWTARRKNDVVIVDRYIYDIVVGFSKSDPRVDDGIRRRLKYFFMFPAPDVLFYIDVPPEVSFSRKNDIPSIEYLNSLKEGYKALLKIYKGAITIDGTKPKEELVRQVCENSKGLLR